MVREYARVRQSMENNKNILECLILFCSMATYNEYQKQQFNFNIITQSR